MAINEKELLTMFSEIKTKLAVIEEKLDQKPTILECQKKHSKQAIFNVVITIIVMVYVFGVKISHLFKFLGL